MTWNEKRQSIAERIGEPDLFSRPFATEQLTPYFDPDLIEKWMYKSSLYFLRQVPVRELESVGSLALTKITSTVPLTVLKVLNAQIDSKPAEFVSPQRWLQMLTCSAAETAIYTIIGGQLQFKGSAISATILIEPTMAQMKVNTILPPGYDEDIISRTITYMLLSDNLPQGRIS